MKILQPRELAVANEWEAPNWQKFPLPSSYQLIYRAVVEILLQKKENFVAYELVVSE